MTVIVAIETSQGVWMGGDRLASDDVSGSILDAPKVFTNGPLLIGVAGSLRMDGLLRYCLDGVHADGVSDLDRWAVKTLAPAIRATLTDGGINPNVDLPGLALFAIAGRVYELESNCALIRSTTGEYAIGSGRHVAYGSLHSTRAWSSPEARVAAALAAAAEHVTTCAGPFDVVWQGTG